MIDTWFLSRIGRLIIDHFLPGCHWICPMCCHQISASVRPGPVAAATGEWHFICDSSPCFVVSETERSLRAESRRFDWSIAVGHQLFVIVCDWPVDDHVIVTNRWSVTICELSLTTCKDSLVTSDQLLTTYRPAIRHWPISFHPPTYIWPITSQAVTHIDQSLSNQWLITGTSLIPRLIQRPIHPPFGWVKFILDGHKLLWMCKCRNGRVKQI